MGAGCPQGATQVQGTAGPFFSDSEFAGRLTREVRRAAYRLIRRHHLAPTT